MGWCGALVTCIFQANGQAFHNGREALCEGFVVGDKTRVQLNAKMLQAVNRYLSSQRVPLLSQEHNVDMFSRLHIIVSDIYTHVCVEYMYI